MEVPTPQRCYLGSAGIHADVDITLKNISLFIESDDELTVSAKALGEATSEEHRFMIRPGDKGHIYCGMDNAIALRDQLTTCIDQAILDDVEAEQG